MMFVLGFEGNRWAWEKKDWRDIEHFHSTQRKWAIAGLVWVAGWIMVGVLLAAVGSGSEAGALAWASVPE